MNTITEGNIKGNDNDDGNDRDTKTKQHNKHIITRACTTPTTLLELTIFHACRQDKHR